MHLDLSKRTLKKWRIKKKNSSEKYVYLHTSLEENCMCKMLVFVGHASYRKKVIQAALSIIDLDQWEKCLSKKRLIDNKHSDWENKHMIIFCFLVGKHQIIVALLGPLVAVWGSCIVSAACTIVSWSDSIKNIFHFDYKDIFVK